MGIVNRQQMNGGVWMQGQNPSTPTLKGKGQVGVQCDEKGLRGDQTGNRWWGAAGAQEASHQEGFRKE